jgi:predicted hotdog family 3-hydroxylacyl-ACP dehydratase
MGMIEPAIPAVAQLIPHGEPMVLLDEVIDSTADRLTAIVTIRPDTRFVQADRGVPAHFAIEYMAQACGAFAGLETHRLGRPVRIGFLLGTRRFQAFASWLRVGWRLTVTAALVFREGQMGVFDCRVCHDATEIAAAQITVYQPDDPASMPIDGT